MNPRQRRGVMLMILAALGAVVVFVSVLSYVGQVQDKVGNLRPVLRITQNVPINSPISSSMVEVVMRPDKWMPQTAFRSLEQTRGLVASTALAEGSYLQQGMVTKQPALEEGEREIAIMINAETGVAAKVQEGEAVDVYATYPASETNPQNCSIRVLSSVPIIQIGTQTQQSGMGATGTTTETVVPITFALGAKESLKLTQAEAFAETVRLARIGGAANSPAPPNDRVCGMPSGSS